MGVVHEAEDKKLARRVALKFLPEYKLQNSESHQRFLRKARAAFHAEYSTARTKFSA